MFRTTANNFTPNHHLHNALRTQESSINFISFLQTLALNPTPNPTNPPIQHNPTVSYLITKCGLPLDSAISASKKLTITSTRKPDSVLNLFKSYGFTQPQIARAITNCPRLLTANLNKNLNPKFEYFTSLGLSKQDIVTHLLANDLFLHYSLTNTIVPTVEFLKTIIHTNENVLCAIKHWPYVIIHNFRIHMEPNVLTMRDKGVPELNISKLLMLKPRAFLTNNKVFRDCVTRVQEMGFRPHSLAYLRAVHAKLSISQALWERKVDVYKSFGWSEEEIIVCFKIQPNFMTCSEKKIRRMMDFVANKLGLKTSDVAKCPNLLMLSIEKNLIPRCSVLQVLVSKGIALELNLFSALTVKRAEFEKMFVTRYQEVLPEIISVYKGEKVPRFEAVDLIRPLGFYQAERTVCKRV